MVCKTILCCSAKIHYLDINKKLNRLSTYSIPQKLAAWAVHLFTASGIVFGFLSILAINEQDWRKAMFWLLICLLVDGLDGTFARMAKVWDVLPYMDGKTMDYVIDFTTYAVIPAYFFYQAIEVPEGWLFPLTAIILLVSVLYYGKTGMVSEDMYFIGFPVLWNMVVFYLIFVFQFPPIGNALFVLFFAILHFVPVKFAYPSQGQRFRKMTLGATVLFFIGLFGLWYYYPDRNGLFFGLAIGTAIYYGLLAIYNTYLE